ncbi:Histidine kinase-, DNA gyrase B-, and HSP90-like ATPase [Streptomyces sp. YIM 121038]|uniref:ATP-binding protein n=1 Tax=Streptomyces sp. YIM 121038 TaxID=2136401 RepID=UPI001110F572|nr:ATP-binding protein [Streptomyces sp. YIM 121038]QCX73962.1 Histidine kinase-, DNA gyrase B-, and HSP90-like ATPase [Streptomyces sp. YIM 121038]
MTPFFDNRSNVALETRPVLSARSETGQARHPHGAEPPVAAPPGPAPHAEDGRTDRHYQRDRRRPGGFRALRLRLPAAADAVPGARHRVRRSVIEWGWGDQVDTVELLFCELLSNAVKHASTGSGAEETVEVCVRQGDASLIVTVDDSGSKGTPAVAGSPVDELAESGRGLLLVEAMASAWGCGRTRRGTRTWFLLDPAGSGPR